MPMPGFEGRRPPPPPPPNFTVVPLAPGEVEVLTVDVRMANKVRCANESIAEEVAALLKIPVKRITVTPWSWALPDPPQSNYLAFLQDTTTGATARLIPAKWFRAKASGK